MDKFCRLHRRVRKIREVRHAAMADERGVTTLEWLLIVAAVAGLAALAVVLVQNVVSDTSEQVAGSSARKTAAQIAAKEIQEEAKVPGGRGEDDERWNTWGEWTRYFTDKCERLLITYSDAIQESELTHDFSPPWTSTGVPTASDVAVTDALMAAAVEDAPDAASDPAQAHCEVGAADDDGS